LAIDARKVSVPPVYCTRLTSAHTRLLTPPHLCTYSTFVDTGHGQPLRCDGFSVIIGRDTQVERKLSLVILQNAG